MTKRPLVPDYIAKLRAYQPGRSEQEIRDAFGLDQVFKLASNESSWGPSATVEDAIVQATRGMHRYPAADLSPLRSELADRFKVKRENIVLGSGSESIMACIIRAFLLDDEHCLTSEGTFVGFQVLAGSRGVPTDRVPQTPDFRCDLKAIADRITERTKIIYIANPNNPTGTYATTAEFEAFVARVPENVLVIWDEAYYEYAQHLEDFPDSLAYRLDNVITLRTFSKAYGLAGLRLGYGIAHENLITNIRKVRLPFEPSVVSLAAGIAALNDEEHVTKVLDYNLQEKPRVEAGLKKLGLTTVPSAANFVMVPLASASYADAIVLSLMRRGIIIRGLGPFGLPHCVRITIGKPEENAAMLSAMSEVLTELGSEQSQNKKQSLRVVESG